MTPLVFPPGKNIRFRWIGAGVLVIGAVVFGIVPVLGFALTRSPSAIPLLLGLPVALLAGPGCGWWGRDGGSRSVRTRSHGPPCSRGDDRAVRPDPSR